MRLHTAAGWRSLILSLALLSTAAWAKRDKPSVELTPFDFIPYNVNYFDDSDVLMFEDGTSHNVYRSENAGKTWHVVEGVPTGVLLEMAMHPYDNQRAYIITNDLVHYKTSDRGKTWEKFESESPASIFREALTFHAGDPDRIIFNAMDCTGIFCEESTLYTTNGFAKAATLLRADTSGCHWAKSSALFTTGSKENDNDRIICVVKGRFSPWRKDYRLLISDDFFKTVGGSIQEFEPELEGGRTVQGIVNMAVITKYLIVAASAEGTDEMALYVSDDTIKWHRAVFPEDHKLTQEAYTVLEGTNYSIQIDVMNTRPSQPMGVFFSSNSNGTYFTRKIEHTNRNVYGLVDFEKVSGIQGIVLVNVVDNWAAVEKSSTQKKIKSQISFDDGRTWEPLKCKGKCKGKELHLHSVTDLSNSGRVFSSPAPGIVMGVGNTGSYLKDYEDGNLYVSDDAGLTWDEALDGPHKYEFGDRGSVLVAIKDDFTDQIRYSIDHGKSWEKADLPKKVRPIQLTTTSDSTSLKFLLEATDKSGSEKSGYIISLDFNDMHERQCKEEDLEDWFARVDDDGKPTCLMGHTQSYQRRKADADCFINVEWKDPVPVTKPCTCTDADFECDYNYVRSADGKKCERKGAMVVPEGACKGSEPGQTFKGTSGWRLIPGNDCERTSGEQIDDLVETKCTDAVGEPSSGKIQNNPTTFDEKSLQDVVYLERTGISSGADETVLVRTDGAIFMSKDHGKTWKHILKDEKITAIYPHPYFNDMVFFLTKTKRVWYSTERGENIRWFDAPFPPNSKGLRVMYFHPKNKDWIIWIGDRDCDSKETCHTVASLTTDRGDEPWKTLRRYVKKCTFIQEPETGYLLGQTQKERERRDQLIYCEVRTKESNDVTNNPWRLVSSDDFFVKNIDTKYDHVVDFATMSEFIVVATKDEEHETLNVEASVDGFNFAPAQFPHGFNVAHQHGYTVLDSSTHSVFLQVIVNNEKDFEYGTIIKSNSNGTSYVLSLENVDSDSVGYVDFEKMFGIEGVAMVNVVSNANAKDYKKQGKKLKTMITHNDGAEWDYLPPPKTDAEEKSFDCKGGLDKCSLHIHGYTERSDKSHTYSSTSAIGLMLGTGNVGEFLGDIKDADTFMTSDGGITWRAAKKGSYMWEFGDQGSIVVIVSDREATNKVYYTVDEGYHWLEHKFADKELRIDDLTTVPSDNSRNFILWSKDDDGKIIAINLDFTGLTDVQCKLDENDVTAGDYELWTPKHPKLDDDCLFGHVSRYHRKKTTSNCYNGRMIPHLHNIEKNCSCTRQDYECDFNYERQSDGSCALVKGFTPPDHSLICQQDENAIEYYDPTGYRRVPITTCQGGKEFDIVSTAHPCPGKGDEFGKKHGVSAVGIFFAVIIPVGIAAGVGYWVWSNWANKFGQIRLGEQSSFDGEAPYIKYPVLAIAGLVAVVQAAPLLIGSLWHSAGNLFRRGGSKRFTTRDSFARGRGDYAIVDEDEGELLGDESDEEV
jgi:hypothetical protein